MHAVPLSSCTLYKACSRQCSGTGKRVTTTLSTTLRTLIKLLLLEKENP